MAIKAEAGKGSPKQNWASENVAPTAYKKADISLTPVWPYIYLVVTDTDFTPIALIFARSPAQRLRMLRKT